MEHQFLTFYTDINRSGKADYKLRILSILAQSPYDSVQMSKLWAILRVLLDFPKPLNSY